MRAAERQQLAAVVQQNCDIVDASHAADLSLCIYLLQMRELYRWQQGLGFVVALDRDAVGQWIERREAHWAALEGRAIEPLTIGGETFAPFDVEPINRRLAPAGLIYGAGLVGPERAVFFLADRHASARPADALAVEQGGREHARGLLAPPAVLQGDTIVLRRESFARWLWERFEAFHLKRPQGPFARVAQAHGLTDTAAFVERLPTLVDALSGNLVLHEQGERAASAWLDPDWATLRLALRRARPAQQLRAVRDHIADLGLTLPALLERGDPVPLHFWFSHYEGWREALYPSLVEAYRAWDAGDRGAALRAACDRGSAHFAALARELIALGDPAAVERRLAEPTTVFEG